jgi:hypothetical protein
MVSAQAPRDTASILDIRTLPLELSHLPGMAKNQTENTSNTITWQIIESSEKDTLIINVYIYSDLLH